jgi:glycosyltransferase involved in cell wall biosynthesis
MHVRKSGPHKAYYGSAQLLWITLNATIKLAQALWSSQADVIHLGKPQPMNVLAARLAARGRPVFCDCDDLEAEANTFTARWQQSIVKSTENGITEWVRGLTVNTHFLWHYFLERNLRGLPIRRVSNGVESSRFAGPFQPDSLRKQLELPPQSAIVVYVGTLSVKSHCVDLLLEAFAQVHRRRPDARLVLVGAGEDYDALVDWVASLGVANHTRFVGRVASSEIPNYFALATVSVDPVRDNRIARARSPLKVVESLACGTPVVTSDVGDRNLMVASGINGQLVPPGEPSALAEGIIRILENATDSFSRSQIRAAIEPYHWDRLTQEFVRIYTD